MTRLSRYFDSCRLLLILQATVDNALVRLLEDTTVSRDILCLLLELVVFFDKEERELPVAILNAAKQCALETFKMDQPVALETFKTDQPVAATNAITL